MIKFPGQRQDEKVLMVIRKHAIVYIRIIIAFLITVVAPLVIFLSVWFNYYPFPSNNNLSVTIGLFSCIYILFGFVLAVIAWINEEFDLFILTDERLIDITQVTLLKRSVASTPLAQIQDTTSSVDGILPTLLNYGNVDVQTAAGSASEFQLDRIPDPAYIARTILNYAHDNKSEKPNKIEESES